MQNHFSISLNQVVHMLDHNGGGTLSWKRGDFSSKISPITCSADPKERRILKNSRAITRSPKGFMIDLLETSDVKRLHDLILSTGGVLSTGNINTRPIVAESFSMVSCDSLVPRPLPDFIS